MQRKKRDFAIRLSEQTLARLDQLVHCGRFKTQTRAIEAAVERLVEAEQQAYERKRRALDEACGVLNLGIDRERFEAAELVIVWNTRSGRTRGSRDRGSTTVGLPER